MKLCYLVKQARLLMGVTQEKFGRMLFVTNDTICRWETGRRDVPVQRIYEIKDWCEYLVEDKEAVVMLFAPFLESRRRKKE